MAFIFFLFAQNNKVTEGFIAGAISNPGNNGEKCICFIH